MGIRLYFRNKYEPKEEYCLGKLFHYANSVDHLDCVDFIVEAGALNDYEWCVNFPCTGIKSGDFLDECVICAYQDYGGLFELSTEDLCLFIYLYRKDQKEFWGPDHIVQYDLDLEDELKFIQKHAAIENRWEFRLGA